MSASSPLPKLSNLITVAQASQLLGLSTYCIYRHISRGELRAWRVGARQLRLDISDLITPVQPSAKAIAGKQEERRKLLARLRKPTAA